MMEKYDKKSVYLCKHRFLFLLPIFITTAAIFSCSSHKPTRKAGDKCSISLKGANANLYLYDGAKFSNKEVDMNKTFNTHIILEDPNYQIAISDIHVRIGGQLFDESWTFTFQTNYRNILTIDANYMINDVEIEVTPSKRTSSRKIFGFERDILVKEGINRDCYTFYKEINGELEVIGTPPDTPPSYEIPGAFSILEDEPIIFKIEDKKQEGKLDIPDNVWVRSNSRFLLRCPDNYVGDDIAWQLEYDFRVIRPNPASKKSVLIHVSKYLVRDHGSFRLNPNVKEAK